MKKLNLFSMVLVAVALTGILFAACLKDPKKLSNDLDSTPSPVTDRTDPEVCQIKISGIPGEPANLFICGFPGNGWSNCRVCGTGELIYGPGTLGQPYSITSFPFGFAVRNTSGATKNVTIEWSCSPNICIGNEVVPIPAGETVMMQLSYENGAYSECGLVGLSCY